MKGRLVGDQDGRNKKETHWRREQAVGASIEGGGSGRVKDTKERSKEAPRPARPTARDKGRVGPRRRRPSQPIDESCRARRRWSAAATTPNKEGGGRARVRDLSH
jgi:hypothetical protein